MGHSYLQPQILLHQHILISTCVPARLSLHSSSGLCSPWFLWLYNKTKLFYCRQYTLLSSATVISPLFLRSVFKALSLHRLTRSEFRCLFITRHFSSLTVGQRLWEPSMALLADMRLFILLEMTGSKPGFQAAYFLRNQMYTCELEKARCCLSHQRSFNTTGANLCQ